MATRKEKITKVFKIKNQKTFKAISHIIIKLKFRTILIRDKFYFRIMLKILRT